MQTTKELESNTSEFITADVVRMNSYNTDFWLKKYNCICQLYYTIAGNNSEVKERKN